VICSDHFDLPEGADIAPTTFICVACHLDAFPKAEPYMVCPFDFLYFQLSAFTDFKPSGILPKRSQSAGCVSGHLEALTC
jgi:hypothetical protein